MTREGNMNAVIIYSGGMDSTVLLHEYRKDIGLAISFDYGSKHNDTEYEYALKNTGKLDIPHKRINLCSIFEHFKSDLLKSGGDIPEGHYEDKSMERTVVPFRNGIMLSVATGIAESNGYNAVMIGNHRGDHAIYPDCRHDFIGAFKEAMMLGTHRNIRLVSPYVFLTKREIATRGRDAGVDFSLTYSCYKGGRTHCGKCGTCVERREALDGFDATVYA